MSELLISNTNYTGSNGQAAESKLELIELPQNYSMLINQLERLALGLDSAFGNFTLDRKGLELKVGGGGGGGGGGSGELSDAFSGPLLAGHVPTSSHNMRPHLDLESEIPVVVSDIWIGVILTLLIVSVIFFICSCFLYHKFQQWKNSYRSSHPVEPVEICRHFPPDYEVESLPSYTIVSGLPTYDAALEEFRKAGIILSPNIHIPVIKLFDKDNNQTKESHIFSVENELSPENDNISVISSTACTCGAANNANTNNSITASNNNLLALPSTHNGGAPQIIELSPDQLAALSQKRLSLQIAFNNFNTLHRGSRRGIDLYRQVNRNNLLRSQAAAIASANAAAVQQAAAARDMEGFPQIHRSSSTLTLSNDTNLLDPSHLQQLQHRGSLY